LVAFDLATLADPSTAYALLESGEALPMVVA
jgi:hypothetical protein